MILYVPLLCMLHIDMLVIRTGAIRLRRVLLGFLALVSLQ